jgi:hypothetical protein
LQYVVTLGVQLARTKKRANTYLWVLTKPSIVAELLYTVKSVGQMVVTGWKLFGQVADRVGEVNRFLANQQLFEGESHLVSPELDSMEALKKESSE